MTSYFRGLFTSTIDAWNRFWFTPHSAETLCLMRILTGLMLVYTHTVWSVDLLSFFGPNSRLSTEFVRAFHDVTHGADARFAWSHLYDIQLASTYWIVHIGAILVLVLFTVGFVTRLTSVLSYLIVVSYAHRATGALFGLDQINSLLAMYLMLGPVGDHYSIDAWLRGKHVPPVPKVSAMIATRLIQLHLCVIYLFAGLGKLLGATWWEGTALWEAFANYEYQTLDMTWLAWHPWLVNALCQFTVAWEVSYMALIWPKITRPLIIAIAVPLHLGIAFCMGMITFGLVMLLANMSFISPSITRETLNYALTRRRRHIAAKP